MSELIGKMSGNNYRTAAAAADRDWEQQIRKEKTCKYCGGTFTDLNNKKGDCKSEASPDGQHEHQVSWIQYLCECGCCVCGPKEAKETGRLVATPNGPVWKTAEDLKREEGVGKARRTSLV